MTLQNSSQALNRRLASSLYSARRYNPVFFAVTGLGFIAVFLLTSLRLLGEPSPQLFYIGIFTILFAAAEIPVLSLAQQNRGLPATLLGSVTAGIFALVLTLFWQGIVPVTVVVALVTPLLALRSRLPRGHVLIQLAIAAAVVGGILAIDARPPLERMQNNTSAAMASIVFLVAAGLLLVTITSISRNTRFRSLQSLLLTSLVVIVTIPIFMTAIFSAIGSYTNSQNQTFATLHSIATLKENQIQNLLFDFQNDSKTLLTDPDFAAGTLEALAATGHSLDSQESLKAQVRHRMTEVLGSEEEAYGEIMVLDIHGEVIISTIPEREGRGFDDQSFFEHGRAAFFAGFADESLFGAEHLIVATPVYAKDGQQIQGVLALRSAPTPIKRIMETTPGFPEAETYLVDPDFRPVTETRTFADRIRTKATTDAVQTRVSEGQAAYSNYAGQAVLGYYHWFEPMQLAIVAEAPASFAVRSSVRALAGSSLLALFVVAMAIAAVAISARAIADPIRTLAQTTENFAAGDLSVRARVERADEIGALAAAYNQMAVQLQETIGQLEQRVADRTKDLESQTLRLRLAAEIARDAASARDLDDLLKRAADLIASRLDLYHTGIYLLDHNKESAVLVAASSDAGRAMLDQNYRLPVGRTGIVSVVSATGEARFALNDGHDAGFVSNPALPGTQSELALPLKVERNVIGVLDIHSSQPHAFSEEDLAVMQVMADQLATAIDRTRLLQEAEGNLRNLESAYGQFTRDNWRRVSGQASGGPLGYRFDNVRLERITEVPAPEGRSAGARGTASADGGRAPAGKEQSVSIPIKLRGQTIGLVNLILREGYDQNTISIVEAAVERLATAMESARLYEEARLRADREQSISRVTSAISASTGYEQILQTTIREIGSILSDTDVAIQILDEPASARKIAPTEQ